MKKLITIAVIGPWVCLAGRANSIGLTESAQSREHSTTAILIGLGLIAFTCIWRRRQLTPIRG